MLKIRPTDQDDLPAIVSIENEAFPFVDAYSLEIMEESLAQQPEFFLVAEWNDRIVGYVMGYTKNDKAHISSMAVAKDVRDKGIGRALLKHIMEKFKDRGAHEVGLEVRPDNAPAISLYKSSGFLERAMIPNYYDSDASPAIVMRKKL